MKTIQTFFIPSLALIFLATTQTISYAQDSCTFVQQDNVIAIEMESGNVKGTYWQVRNDIPGYSGSGYVEYIGSDLTGVSGKSVITYKFKVTEAGKYSFKMRGYRPNYHANDVWVRFPEGETSTEINNEYTGTPGNDWFKVMIGPRDTWFYFASTHYDHDGTFHQIFVTYDEPGIYSIEFSGRALGFIIDRFTLHKTRTSDGMNPMVPESQKEDCHPYQATASFPYVINPIPDQYAFEDVQYSYTIPTNTFEHPEGKTLHYAVFQRGMEVLPEWLTFNPSTRTLSGTPSFNDGGVYYILVRAQNGHEFAIDEYKLTVTGNKPPVVQYQLNDTVAVVGEEFVWVIPNDLFHDEDGHTLTYSTSSNHGHGVLPAWLTYDELTKTFRGTAGEDHIGFDTIHISVNDGHGGTASTSFEIHVKPAGIQSVKKFNSINAKVYPNPATDRIIIKCEDRLSATVELLDHTGRVLYSSNEGFSDEFIINLDEVKIDQGMYFLNVRSENNKGYSGLILKR